MNTLKNIRNRNDILEISKKICDKSICELFTNYLRIENYTAQNPITCQKEGKGLSRVKC